MTIPPSDHDKGPAEPLPPLVEWVGRHSGVLLFLAVLVPVVIEGCAIRAAQVRDAARPAADVRR